MKSGSKDVRKASVSSKNIPNFSEGIKGKCRVKKFSLKRGFKLRINRKLSQLMSKAESESEFFDKYRSKTPMFAVPRSPDL